MGVKPGANTQPVNGGELGARGSGPGALRGYRQGETRHWVRVLGQATLKGSTSSGWCRLPARVVEEGRLRTLYFWHTAAGDMLDAGSVFQNMSNVPSAWYDIWCEACDGEECTANLEQ